MEKRARSTSPRTDIVATGGSSDDQGVPDHIAWATCIKRHHQAIRETVKTRFHGDADAAWASVVEDKAALTQYATCMHHLATKYWASEEGDLETEPNGDTAATKQAGEKFRYDDRVQYALRCMQEYFFGPQPGSGGAVVVEAATAPSDASQTKTYLPFVATAALKAGKRAYYDEHKTSMPPHQQFDWLVNALRRGIDGTVVAASDRCCSIRQRVLSHLQNMYGVRADDGHAQKFPCALAPLTVLDVGSCYGPLRGKTLDAFVARPPSNETAQDAAAAAAETFGLFCPVMSEAEALRKWCQVPQPLDVVSVDLCPYEGSGVLQCDWLTVPLRCEPSSAGREPVEIATVDEEREDSADVASTTRRVKCISMSSFDVVHFSLVLSYMPSPEMRFRALARAHAVLKDDGLLIVISTRTQGPRQTGWVDAWVSAITTLGFTRVHKTVQCRLIGLTFQKSSGERQSESGPPPTCDGNVLLWSDEERAAAAKLTITADAVL